MKPQGIVLSDDNPLRVSDPVGLTESDWAVIHRIRAAFDEGGFDAFQRAIRELEKDPALYMRIMGAFYPYTLRDAIKDAMAMTGITVDDLRDFMREGDAANEQEKH